MISIQKMHLQKQQLIKQIEEDKKQVQRTRLRKQKNSNPPIFISKTYQILQNNVHRNVINWNEEGIFFIISDVQKFQEQVLPIHFRHRNFSSFVRQLNMYDFHKIRNDNNINIFEHKQFKRGHKQCLKNIKRKGSCNKKNKQNQLNQQNMSISQHQEIQYENQETPRNESNQLTQEKQQKTVETIEKNYEQNIINSLKFIRASISPTLQKGRKMQYFMNSLPAIIETQQQVQKIINQLKKDPQYECLNTKNDIKKLILKIRRKLPKRESNNDLQQLSIQEQILAQKIDYDDSLSFNLNPSLAILSTEKFLPKSINLIGSMNFCEQTEHLFFQKLY